MKKLSFLKKWLSLYKSSHSKNMPNLAYMFLYLCLLPMHSYADGVVDIINNGLGLLTGDYGTAFCTLAIVAVGYLCLFAGVVPKKYLIVTVVAIGVIFGAQGLLTELHH